MSLLVLASASGAPGVTSTALGLAVQWPGEVVLLDADRSASQAVLAGYLKGQSPQGRGMQGLLHAHRERRDLRVAFAENRMVLPSPPQDQRSPADVPPRWFVPGFAHLRSIDHVEGLWSPLIETTRDGPDVIVDAGRVGYHGLPGSLLAAADAIGMVCRTSLVSLAALPLHLPPLVEAAPPGRVGLILVGPGRPYSAREVSEQFGLPILAEIAWDAKQAADLADGVPVAKNWSRQSLARSYDRAARSLRHSMSTGRVTRPPEPQSPYLAGMADV